MCAWAEFDDSVGRSLGRADWKTTGMDGDCECVGHDCFQRCSCCPCCCFCHLLLLLPLSTAAADADAAAPAAAAPAAAAAAAAAALSCSVPSMDNVSFKTIN